MRKFLAVLGLIALGGYGYWYSQQPVVDEITPDMVQEYLDEKFGDEDARKRQIDAGDYVYEIVHDPMEYTTKYLKKYYSTALVSDIHFDVVEKKSGKTVFSSTIDVIYGLRWEVWTNGEVKAGKDAGTIRWGVPVESFWDFDDYCINEVMVYGADCSDIIDTVFYKDMVFYELPRGVEGYNHGFVDDVTHEDMVVFRAVYHDGEVSY